LWEEAGVLMFSLLPPPLSLSLSLFCIPGGLLVPAAGTTSFDLGSRYETHVRKKYKAHDGFAFEIAQIRH
jgi:hypothetical protein